MHISEQFNFNTSSLTGMSLHNCLAKVLSSVLNWRFDILYEDKFYVKQFSLLANRRTDNIIALKQNLDKNI